MKARRLWLVVADGSRAQILSREAADKPLKLVKELDHAAARLPGREIVTDGPGRTFDSGGQGRHATAAPTDPHEHEKLMFIDDLAGQINKAVAKNKLDDLVLFAAPHALGRLRDKLSKQAQQRVAADLGKDLTAKPVKDLEKRLKELVGPWE